MDDVCVIVPVYNEATTLEATICGLLSVFSHVVCVDDGSTDNSPAIARASGAVVVEHPLNLGQGAALQTGFDYVLRHTRAAHVVTFDADGQHLVSDAVRMVDHARSSGVHVVLASRFSGAALDMPGTRRVILRAATLFTRWTANIDVTDTHNGLRVLSRQSIELIRLQLPRMAHASELLNAIAANGLTYAEVPATVLYTTYSKAKGQRHSAYVNILYDLAMNRLRTAR